MGRRLIKSIRGLVQVLAVFTPAKLEAWRRFIVTLSFFFLVLLLVAIVLAITLVWILSELDKLGYGSTFFILWMCSVGRSR
jgi:hypothetical protein